jgi:hypothetical protein
MLLHAEYAEVSDIGANACLFPANLRLKPSTLFTRRFEAQLHWCPGLEIRCLSRGARRPAGKARRAHLLGISKR